MCILDIYRRVIRAAESVFEEHRQVGGRTGSRKARVGCYLRADVRAAYRNDILAGCDDRATYPSIGQAAHARQPVALRCQRRNGISGGAAQVPGVVIVLDSYIGAARRMDVLNVKCGFVCASCECILKQHRHIGCGRTRRKAIVSCYLRADVRACHCDDGLRGGHFYAADHPLARQPTLGSQ